jgi:2-polyprenyl-3-methyl-5-hydroxy-6-metoxy-1,4-benzoquinol methylase
MNSIPAQVELESSGCPLGCAPDDVHVLESRDRLNGLPGRFRIVRCRGCGLMRTDPRPTPASIGFYYPETYSPYLVDGPPARPAKPRAGWKRAIDRIAGAGASSHDVPPLSPGRLLEIGCSGGAYLEEMRSRGWQVEGVEFSAHAAAIAQGRGLRVHVGALESIGALSGPFDLIAGWMVLEHLHRPVEVLRMLRGVAHERTWLALSVPDAAALQFRVFGPALYSLHLPNHLYHFTSETLVRVLAAGGWRLQRTIHQQNPNDLLQSLRYLALDHGWADLARALEETAAARRNARLRRLLGMVLGKLRQSGRMTVWARAASRTGA